MVTKALVIVDVENDFLPGGALGVRDGDKIIPLLNDIQKKFDTVVATLDWHPFNHISFAESHHKKVGDVIDVNGIQQILWPRHCVQNTEGSQFAVGFDTHHIVKIFHKGVDPQIDSYSAFFDNAENKSTGLDLFLKEKKVTDLYIAGLTTEYCVKYSALDAKRLGFNVFVILDACRPVELHPGDERKAIDEMKKAGVHII